MLTISLTLRLARLRSEDYENPDTFVYQPSGSIHQEIAYDYDLVGNVTTLRDRAPESGIANTSLGPDALDRAFAYDPLYRLLSATGREHDGPVPTMPWTDEVTPQDPSLIRAYSEIYKYDGIGNLLELNHSIASNGFARVYTIDDSSNRVTQMTAAQNEHLYQYDANGNSGA